MQSVIYGNFLKPYDWIITAVFYIFLRKFLLVKKIKICKVLNRKTTKLKNEKEIKAVMGKIDDFLIYLLA